MLAQEILLKAKKSVWSSRVSDNTSKIRGTGMDFCEIRPYQLGDDVRHINFLASSKGEELQTNVFNEDRQMSVVISALLTSSLYFGSHILKTQTVAETVAILGFSSLKQHHATKIVLFGKEMKVFILKSQAQLLEIIEYILNYDYKNIDFDLQKVQDFLLNHHKSFVVALGDFYTDYDLGAVAHKHQLSVVIIRDMLEENPEFLDNLDLVNLQNNHKISIDFNHNIVKKYQNTLQNMDEKTYTSLQKHRANIGKIYTTDDSFLKLNSIIGG